ncbi:MAG: thioredoxin domain-containing protein [Candidatus Uhrbacteria bacterium]
MDRRKALYLLLGLFGLVCALLVWSFIYRDVKTFETGKPPAIQPAAVIVPTQPAPRASDPARGSASKDALVITEYADFSSIYSRAAEPELRSVLLDNKDIRHVWRDFPAISDSPLGMLSAAAGRCAGEQGHFWEMHDALITSPRLDNEMINLIAQKLGLNTANFDDCISSGVFASAVQQDVDEARANHLTNAPTFFIGKSVLSGQITASDLRWAILKARIGQ